ncbi:prenyltransferase, UbiA family protein [Hypoxylon sp. EC38]|nr:prenyltransferase, UbiA family protein [Hypoxylon sp. EC38]
MNSSQEHKEPPTTKKGDTEASLSQQYGGTHTGGWVNVLPRSWIPYIQLARLSPPAALFLIYFPHLFGVLHAANLCQQPASEVIRTCILLLGGSLFFSNAAHAWNDLVDAPIDKLVSRTKKRPIPRGDITWAQALVFTAVQSMGAACFLLFFQPTTAVTTVPTIVGTTYYPWAKRHTHFPQLVLGFCLSWGIMVGSSATGIESPWRDSAALCLLFASILWTTIYDTIYAYQDIEDDERIGVGSTAVLFRSYTKTLLWVLIFFLGACLLLYGEIMHMGTTYYIVTVSGCLSSLSAMVANVELKNHASCWWWFSCGFWFTGVSITIGLLAGYLDL